MRKGRESDGVERPLEGGHSLRQAQLGGATGRPYKSWSESIWAMRTRGLDDDPHYRSPL
jgi:hypothetical protein